MVSIDPEIKQGRSISYHKNGAVWQRTYYENDTIQGTADLFHDNGVMEASGEMVNGGKTGSWTFFYPNGNPIGTAEYENDLENGYTVLNYDTGSKHSEGNFLKAKKQGFWKYYHPNGNLSSQGNHEGDAQVGDWIYYHENGRQSELLSFDSLGRYNGEYQRFHTNGELETEGYYQAGLAQGHFTYYYDNGVISSEGEIKDDLFAGHWTYYHANGNKSSVGSYLSDKETGEWTYYHENGEIKTRGSYATGERDGKWQFFYSPDLISGEEHYSLGTLDGPAYQNYPNGRMKLKGQYLDGQKDGRWEYWHDNGVSSSIGTYAQGEYDGYYISYHENGNKKSEGNYIFGRRDSVWSYYNEKGIAYATGNYKDGNSTGFWKYFHSNGELKQEGKEFADKSFGLWKDYDEKGRLESVSTFTDGKRHGVRTFYDSLGKVSDEVNYVNGVAQNFSNLFDSADHLSLNGKFEEALLTMQKAEEVYFANFGKNDLKKSDLYELKGAVYARMRAFRKAEKFIRKSLAHSKKLVGDTSVWYTSTLDNLADLYTDQDEYTKAAATYERVIDLVEKRKNGRQSREHALAMRYYAVTLMDQERDMEAAELLYDDIEMRRGLPDQENNIAENYYSIVDAISDTDRTDLLDSAILNALNYHEENDLKDKRTYADTHYSLAQRLSNLEKNDSAQYHYRKCAEWFESVGDTIDYRFVKSLLLQAQFHYNRSEYSKSRPIFRRVQVLSENPIIKRQPYLYDDILAEVGNQMWADEDYDSTLYYAQSLRDHSEKYDLKVRLGQSYSSMALAYDALGDKAKAENSFERSIKAFQATDGYSRHHMNSRLQYANFLRDEARSEEALTALKAAEDYLHQFDDVDSIYYYRLQQYYGDYFIVNYAYDSVIYYASKVVNELGENPGRNTHQYLVSLSLLGRAYRDMDLFEQARTYHLKYLEESKKLVGTETHFYADALLSLGRDFASEYNHETAIKYFQDAIEYGLKSKNEITIAPTRLFLAEQLWIKERYNESGTQLTRVKAAYEAAGMTQSTTYLWCLRFFGRLYEEQDDFITAEKYYLRMLEITEETFDPNSELYASQIRRIGSFYLRIGEPRQAYDYVSTALRIAADTYGKESMLYAWYGETMSSILYELDDYVQAVNLQEEVASIYLKLIGPGQDYRDAVFSLGELLAEIGQYEKSIENLEKSRNSVLDEWGRFSFAYTTDTKEIASTYLLWNKPKEALKELRVVRDLYDSIGVHRSNYASLHNFFGWAQQDVGMSDSAKYHYMEAIQIADSTWGENSRASNTYRNNLAFYYQGNKEYSEAERLWLGVEEKFSDSELSRADWLGNIAGLYTMSGELQKAKPYWEELNRILIQKITSDFNLLSESGKAAFWDSRKGDFARFNAYAVQAHLSGDSEALGQMYNNQLQTKSILLNTSTKERQRILNSGNKTLISTYKRYLGLREQLVLYYGYTSDQLKEESIDIASLEAQAESLEKALSLTGAGEASQAGLQDWRKIQRALLPGEAAIELIRFRSYTAEKDSILYAAIILNPRVSDAPILELFTEGEFMESRAIKAYRSSIQFKLDDNRSFTTFWAPIHKHLDGTNKVYFAGDGVYHQLNPATLRLPDGSYVRDQYDLRLVSSTRTITEVTRRNRKSQDLEAYIFGNPKFDLAHSQIENSLQERGLKRDRAYTRATTLENFSFSELPGTKTETETVNTVLDENNWSTHLFLGENALEDELKRVNNPTLLHIATHGFFLDAPDESNDQIQLGVQAEAGRKNALLRSGLLMAGATQTAQGAQNRSIENGIFTAYEAMNLDLSDTELVILSACETGLGEIKNGEGVFGLQRAFQIAGAKSILMSLWKVDDAATQLLMTSFYDAWIGGKTETEALHHAQDIVKEKYPHPNYWGAFVVVGQ